MPNAKWIEWGVIVVAAAPVTFLVIRDTLRTLCLICHVWHPMSPRKRVCLRCARFERLEFYSNRTQEWVEDV